MCTSKIPFPHRKPSLRAREAMAKAALNLGTESEYATRHKERNKALKQISAVTRHRHVKLVSSGDCAIFAVAKAINGKIMIPDQGGWKGFKYYPQLLGLEVCEVPTNLGMIDPSLLVKEIGEENPKALFLTSFAGYIAEQDFKEIARVCKENEVMLVEDASGAIGDKRLGNGKYSDVILCSTGAPKIINLTIGGFFSTNKREIIDNSIEITSACKLSPVICAGIIEELKKARERIEALVNYSNVLKEELSTAVHKERRGICAGFELRDKNPRAFALEARKKGLMTDFNQGFLTTCPRYERFLRKGIVVELKKLDVLEISEEDAVRIAAILKSCGAK
jgi:hypothetical protein